MNRVSTLLFLTLLCFIYPPVFGQSEDGASAATGAFQPDARSVGFGGSLVVQARDPSAIFWNPALLSSLKDRSVLLSVDEPFEFTLASLTQFIPLYGTFGFSLIRIPTAAGNIDRGTFGWGRHLSKWVSVGGTLNFQRRSSRWFSAATLGLHVGNSRVGTLGQPWRNYADSRFLDKFSFGVAIHDLPFSEKVREPSALFGMSYLIPKARLLLNTGYHVNDGDNTAHFGFGVAVSDQLTLFSGLEDFDFDRLGFGVGYTLDNFVINTGYSTNLEQLFVSVTARIGPSPEAMARPHYIRGARSLNQEDYKKANRELKKYLSYRLHNQKSDSARILVNLLDREVRQTRSLVDSLHGVALDLLKQSPPKFQRAALFLTRILELDPNNASAQSKLTTLKPIVDDLIKTSLEDGVFQYEAKNYDQAAKDFARVLAFDRDNDTAIYYMGEIRRAQHEMAEEHFYRGIGFYRQKNYALAFREFSEAIAKNSELDEARSYLKRTQQKMEEMRAEVAALLAQGRELERKGSYYKATSKYLDVLKRDKNNQRAQYRLATLRPKVEQLIRSKYNEAAEDYRQGDYVEAEDMLTEVLNIAPNNKEAKDLLAKTRNARKRQTDVYLSEAARAFENKQWQTALDAYDSALKIQSGHAAAKQGRVETLRQIDIAGLIGRARKTSESKAFRQAIELYHQVLQLDPDNQVAKEEMQSAQRALNAKIEKIFTEGINFFTLDRYEQAMAKWQEVLQLDPDHEGALDYKKQTEERIEALKNLDESQ